MEDIAAASRAAYQKLLAESGDFMAYFRAATPIDVIERIGSKSERAEHVGVQAEETRAAQWIFAWTQNRCLLPSWYGVATGLKKAHELHGEAQLLEMFEQWHFFRVLVLDAGTALAKADLDIMALYSRLSGEQHERFFPVDPCGVSELRRAGAALEPAERAARGVAHAAARDPLAQSLRGPDELPPGGSARALARERPAERRGAPGAHRERQRHRARDANRRLGSDTAGV